MSESVEMARFMEKPFALAKASRQYFERLLKIGAKVSESGASTASLFSDVINLLTSAVLRMAGFSKRIRELSLARNMFLPPFDLWSKKVTLSEEDYLPTEMGRAHVSFLLNVTVARRIAAELARRMTMKTPTPALLESTPYEAELMEKPVEEPTRTVPHFVADVQKRLGSKLAPSMRGIGMDFEEYGRKAILSAPPEEEAPEVGLPERSLATGSWEYAASLPSLVLRHAMPILKRLAVFSMGAPPSTVVSQVPFPPPEEAQVKPSPLTTIPVVRFSPEAVRSFSYATGLPSIVIKREFPVLKTQPTSFPQVSAGEMDPPLPPTKPPIEMIGSRISIPIDRLGQDIASLFEYVASLPSLVLRHAMPILKRLAVFSMGAPPSTVVSQVPFVPPEEAKGEPAPLAAGSVMRLTPGTAGPIEIAAGLPSILLRKAFSALETTSPFSPVSPPELFSPSIESSQLRIRPMTLPEMRPSLVSRLLEEISPSLTSWIYGVSEVLRGTTLSLSAVPVAASAAEKVVTEALIQPIPSVEAPEILAMKEPVSPVLPPSGFEASAGRAEVEAFRLPAFVASLVVALSQRYPLFLGEPAVSETYGASYELSPVVPEETSAFGRMPEEESFSKLPTVIALAAAESLIAQRLHQEFGALIGQMRVARSSYGERLGELGAFRPMSAPVLSRLKAAAPAARSSSAVEPYTHRAITSVPTRLPRVGPASPSVQNTFNITISAESAEEDLRDLERKISRILSEQIRRYYGSPRM